MPWTVNPLVGGPEDAHPVGVVLSEVDNRYIAVMQTPAGGFLAASSATRMEAAAFAALENGDLPEGLLPRSIAISDDSVATSVALLNRDGKLWIEHGGERYLLRRTANNRLILTK